MDLLYYFIGGMLSCVMAYFLYPHLLNCYTKTKETTGGKLFLLCFISFLLFILILGLLFFGIISLLICLVMSIIILSTHMFNALDPGAIEYNDFLNIIVQITSLFGTVSIAAAAYLFKKKS